VGSFLVSGFIRVCEPYSFVKGETDNKSTFIDKVILDEETVNLLQL
jgi:hypothetical protein